jgi:dephospho-CoA kinase
VRVIGLTGSIGMGKSTTAAMFRELGVPVHDADAVVHRLYEPGGAAVDPVGAAFPGVARDGRIDREALSARVLGDPEALARLNAIVHPLVRRERDRFLEAARADGADLVVYDVPLLFETGGHENVDVVVVATAPAEIQRARVLARSGMTPERLDAILARQLPDAEKRARAHHVVDTGRGLDDARGQVAAIVGALRDSKAG